MKCNYDPRDLAGQPIGMFHCPECGQMVIAGLPHDIKKEEFMQATVEAVEPKETKSHKTYYRIQADGKQLSVWPLFKVGDVIEYEQGDLPDWPHNVRRLRPDEITNQPPRKPSVAADTFGRVEFAQLLEAVAGIAVAAGITDHQAITALNNTLLIALQKQGVKIDVGSFIGAPF